MNENTASPKPKASGSINKIYLAASLMVIALAGSTSVFLYLQSVNKNHQIVALTKSSNDLKTELNTTSDKLKTANNEIDGLRKESSAYQKQIEAIQASQNQAPKLQLSVKNVSTEESSAHTTLPANQHIVFVDIAITNNGNAIGTLSFEDISQMKLVGSDGKTYIPQIGSSVPQEFNKTLIAPQSIASGQSAAGSIYLNVDKSVTTGTLWYGSQSVSVTIP